MRAYQFKISLEGSQPLLWRRCLVPVNLSLLQFSAVIQLLFGWSGSHQAFFSLPGHKEHWYANVLHEELEQGFLSSNVKAASTRLDDFVDENKCFSYTYDLGDNWEHRIEVEKLAEDYPYSYPQVQKAVGDNPLEDCGGVSSLNAEEPLGERVPLDLEKVNGVLSGRAFQPQPLPAADGAGEDEEPEDMEDIEAEAEAMEGSWRGLFAPEFVKFLDDHEGFRQMTPREQCELLQSIVADSFGFADEDGEGMVDGQELDDDGRPRGADGTAYACVDVRLEDTLEGLTKQDLQDVAEIKGFEIPKSLLKDEYKKRLCAKMLEPGTLRRCLLWLSWEEMASLLCVLNIEPPAEFGDYLKVPDEQSLFGLPSLTLMGYAAMSMEQDVGVPLEVATAIRRLLTADFWQDYHATMWMEAVLSLAEDIYQVFTLQTLMKVLRRQPDFALTEEEVLQLFASIPPDIQHFYFHEGVLQTDENLPPETARLIILSQPSYYIPSIEEVWKHNIFDPKGEPIMEAMFARLDSVWDSWRTSSLIDVMTPLLHLMLQNAGKDNLREQFMAVFDEMDPSVPKSLRQTLWKQLWPFFRRLQDHVRLPANHGFSNEELREQKRQERREEKAKRREDRAADPAKAAKKSNKVISLAERRRHRTRKK